MVRVAVALLLAVGAIVTVVVVEKRIVDRGLEESLFTEAELARAQP